MQNEFCSLCFAPCELSEPIEEDAKQSLTQLLPYLDVVTRGDRQIACTNCSRKLRGYLGFKSSLLQTQAYVQSYGTEQNGGLLDLRQAYLQNEGNGSEVSAKDFVVCRFCLKQVTGTYIALVEDQKELTLVAIMIGKCFPELELGRVSGCVICFLCRDALETSYDFVTSLHKTEKIDFEDRLDVKTVLLASDGFGSGFVDFNAFKEEDLLMALDEAVEGKAEGGFEQVDDEKLEEKCKVKIEASQTDSSRNQNKFDGSEKNVEVKEEDTDVKEYSFSLCEDDACDVKVEQAASERNQDEYKWNETNTKIKEENVDSEQLLTKHILVHKDSSDLPLLHCDQCPYFTLYPRGLALHKVVHKTRPSVEVLITGMSYKCKVCPYETKHKSNYNRHLRVHNKRSVGNDTSFNDLYKCESCSFESKHRKSYNQHKIIHLDPSEVTMYKCEQCSYETRRKGDYHHHITRMHKSASEVPMYKCAICSFETKVKGNLVKHMLNHKNSSEVIMYKCESCAYETRHKQNLAKHKRVHKNPWELQMYKCKACPYETKHNSCYNQHIIKHKNPSEVPIFKCELCGYESKRKGSLIRHKLTHRSPSEITMYPCPVCPFETKLEAYLRKHMLVHKDPSELQMYKCEVCPYENKLKSNLLLHLRVHKKPSEVTMYKCTNCMFQTRYKRNLKNHELVHKNKSE